MPIITVLLKMPDSAITAALLLGPWASSSTTNRPPATAK